MNDHGSSACYTLCGATLASNVPLPELLPHDSENADLAFQLLPAGEPEEGAEPRWYHHALHTDGSRWLSLARKETGYLLRFDGLADFTFRPQESRVECRPGPGTPDETIRHLLLDQVVPLVLGHRGTTVLHAGAVADGDAAAAFVGEAGWGKSTLAACLCRLGWSLLSDDGLPLREAHGIFLAESSYPGLRLWPDSLHALFGAASDDRAGAGDTAKRRLRAGSMALEMCSRRVPLRAVYLLDPEPPATRGEEVAITPLAPREGLLVLLKYLFRIDAGDRDRLREEFERLARLAGSVPVRRLSLRRGLERLPSVALAVRRDLRSVLDRTRGSLRAASAAPAGAWAGPEDATSGPPRNRRIVLSGAQSSRKTASPSAAVGSSTTGQ